MYLIENYDYWVSNLTVADVNENIFSINEKIHISLLLLSGIKTFEVKN